MSIIGYTFVPFVTWEIALTILVGFYFPLLHSKRKGHNVNWYSEVFLVGLKRARNYKWEIFFASISGIVFTDIYIFFQDFARGQILSFLYRIIGIAFLVTLLFGKSYKIASHPPFSIKKSIRFLWGGFLNPFKKSNLKKLKNFLEKDRG